LKSTHVVIFKAFVYRFHILFYILLIWIGSVIHLNFWKQLP